MGSTNVSSYLFPILSNGNSYFILHIKTKYKNEETGRICLQYELPWEMKIKMSYQDKK